MENKEIIDQFLNLLFQSRNERKEQTMVHYKHTAKIELEFSFDETQFDEIQRPEVLDEQLRWILERNLKDASPKVTVTRLGAKIWGAEIPGAEAWERIK